MTTTIATTLAPHAMYHPNAWGHWLNTAETIASTTPVRFFAAIEIDARGLDPFTPLLDRLAELDGTYWTFHVDDGAEGITTDNRLRRITTGQNLCMDYCCAADTDWLLFMAADCKPPGDCLPRLQAHDRPIVGGHVSTYGLTGPEVAPGVREHMASAAFVMLRRDAFRVLRWRWDRDAGMSDDPCLWHDARTYHGWETWVDHTVVGEHWPVLIGPMEDRYPDRKVRR